MTDVRANRFAGRDKRLRLLEDIAEGQVTFDVTEVAAPASQASATWYQTGGNRIDVGNLQKSTSEVTWAKNILSSEGAAIDANCIGLMPGKYRVTLNLNLAHGAAGLSQYRFALTDDGTDNTGDTGVAAYFENGTDYVVLDADANDTRFVQKVLFLDLPDNAGYSTDASAGDEEQGFHCLYFCAADNAATGVNHVVNGMSQIIIERVG